MRPEKRGTVRTAFHAAIRSLDGNVYHQNDTAFLYNMCVQLIGH